MCSCTSAHVDVPVVVSAAMVELFEKEVGGANTPLIETARERDRAKAPLDRDRGRADNARETCPPPSSSWFAQGRDVWLGAGETDVKWRVSGLELVRGTNAIAGEIV